MQASPITGATVSTIGTKTYNGRLQRPTVTVKLGTTTLKNGTDYTVSYRNNKKVINVTRNKTTSKTFKKLKKGKRYYVKVRSYKKVDGKKLYGAYSKAKKTAKIKR